MYSVTEDEKNVENIFLPPNMKNISTLDQFLKTSKEKINYKDPSGRTMLQYAAENGDADIVKLLLEYKADTEICDKNNQTPLHWAARNHQPEVVKILLEHQANVDCKTCQRRTPLHFAVMCAPAEYSRSLCVVQQLIDRKASFLPDMHDQYPVERAAEFNNKTVVDLLKDTPGFLQLKDSTTKIKASDDDFYGQLRIASYCGINSKVEDYIRECPGAVDRCDKNGSSSLHYASKQGHDSVVITLLRAGAKIDTLDASHRTPLHLAVMERLLSTVIILLENGANCLKKDKFGYTPLDYAAKDLFNYEEIYNLIERKIEEQDCKEKTEDSAPVPKLEDKDKVLSVRNFNEIFQITKKIASKWKRVGKGLGFKKKDLDRISNRNEFCRFDEDYKDLINEWLSWTPPVNQKDLAKLLQDANTVSILNTTSTSMIISWQPPLDPNGIITGYQVSYTPHGERECLHNVNRDITSTELTSLKPHTEYIICVRAKTVDFGDYSKVVIANTLEGVPSPPIGLKAFSITSTSMTISWQPPHDPNGIIRGYQVSYTPHGESECIHGVVGDTTSTKLTSLQPHTDYTIRVRAKTVDFGGYSTLVTVSTKEDVPSPPIGLKAFSITSTSMTISWQPPHDPNGIIRGYQVSYTPHGESECLHDVNGDTASTELTSLKSHTEYTIRVRAKTVDFGDYSTLVTVSTKEDDMLAVKLSTILANYKDISFHGFKIGKLIFYGTPRAGKTTLRKNLVKHTEGMLYSSDAPEPSTYIAEISDPILVEQVEKDESVQRILAKKEENNEWKWTVQGLDDVAKTLLQSLDIKLSNNKAKQQNVSNSTKEGLLHNPANVTTGYENIEQTVQTAITTSTSGSDKALVHTDVEQPNRQVPTLPIAIGKQSEERSSSKVDIKQCFLDAIKTGRWSEVVSALNILDKSMLLQVIDGGGQPSFQEIFPLLIGCPAVKLIIFKLTDKFHTPYPAEYQPKHGRAQTWHDSGYVVRDFIFQAISSLPDLPTTDIPTKIQYDPKLLLLVGTHKDKLEGSEEMKAREIQRYAESIHELILQSKAFESQAFNWIKGKNIEDFLVGVSNTNQKDIMEVKKKIEQLIFKTDPAGIPAPWLVFDFVLHKYAKSKQLHKVEREMCNEIAKVCHLKDDEIEVLLYFLHNKAGTILYYYDIPELKNWIITDFQLIIDSISEVIIQYYGGNGKTGQMGQVKIESLRSIDGYLEVDQLLSLMKHRHIISYKEKATTFFMPSLLPKAEGIPVSSQSSDSLLVIFESGYSPIGLFCAVSTHLIDSHNWEINTTDSQCRNNMSFYYVWSGAQYGIVFTSFSTYYEVHLSSNVEYPPKIKFDIYRALQASFTAVCKDIDLIPPSYGFYCTCKGAGCPQHAHPAKVGDGYEKMECCYSGVQDELTEQQKTWFQQVHHQVHSNEKHFTIINGKSDVFEIDKYGLSISVSKNCLPPDVKECNIVVTADLTTNIALPSGTSLVSGVYHIKTMPFIDAFIQPVELSMVHCANDFSELSFVVAREQESSKFEYLEGGTFAVDANSGTKIGRINVCSFSKYSIIVWNWITGSNIEYCGRVYYKDYTGPLYRNVSFVITKNLPLANELIAETILMEKEFHTIVEFDKSQICLELPKEIVAAGWEFESTVNPAEITKKAVDNFGRGMLPPECSFRILWKSPNQLKPHIQEIKLSGARRPLSIKVVCFIDQSERRIKRKGEAGAGGVKKRRKYPASTLQFGEDQNERAMKRREEAGAGGLKKRREYPASTLQSTIVDLDIARIAGNLPDWQLVARKLEFGEENIKDIETKYNKPEDMRKEFLRKWIWKNKPTYAMLYTALEERGEQGAADKICEIASERSNSVM